MRGFVALAVRRRVSVVMTALAVMAFGYVGYQRLPLELFPDISYPSLTVQTDFTDTAPQEIETLVTRPVEEAVGVLRGLQSIRSVSRSGVSEVTLEFDWDTDMDMISMEVREKLDRLVLPEGSEDPIVLRFDPSLDPIARVALSAASGDLTELRELAEYRIKPDLETLKGIAAAQIRGGLEEEIQVDVDQERLAALGIPLERVRQIVGGSNVNLPGGSLRGQDDQYLIRTINEFDDVDEIGDLVVSISEGATVRVRDVAEVRRGTKERDEITRVNGREAVEISIYKEGDANTVTAAQGLKSTLRAWNDKLPAGHELTILFDQSQFIEQAISEVRDAAVIGGGLAILVLLAFLRDLRSTFIVATSIPISVVATFMLMYRMDVSLNIMSLGGLTLGIGMLVDNSIVVLESIFRKRTAGRSLTTASVEGTTEVGSAVVASTLTTVAVFLPIVFVEGIAGQLFHDQALTVTISLLASLVVAITVIPMLSAWGRQRKAPTVAAEDAPAHTLGRFSQVYDQVVRAALAHKVATVLVAFAAFAGSLAIVPHLGTELIPEMTQGEFFLEVNMPEGTSLAGTDRVTQELEAVAAGQDALALYYSTVGSRLIAGGMSLNTKGENLGQLNVVLRDRTDAMAEGSAMQALREASVDVPDLQVKFGRPSYFSLQTPIQVVLFGDDLEDLRTYSLELAQSMATISGLVDVRSSLEAGNPEVQVVFDRDRLAALGLDMATLSQTLRDRVQGAVPTTFKRSDRQIDIRVRNTEATRSSIEDVRRLMVTGPGNQPIRLLEVADVRLDRGPAEIHREQQQRAAVVSANLRDRSLGDAIADVDRVLASIPPPPGVTTEMGGQNREMKVSFASLRFAMALAIFLVYLVMAGTFESFIHPLIVLSTIPLALVGVVAGLLVTGTPITVIVLIGTIMLVGIVVNNAIVLIDTINRLRRDGLPKAEAVVRAGHIRLRPILMTTLTTILGLLPMAVAWGEGAELRQPLAVTVAAGLFLSTLLTLVVIPAAYQLVPSKVEGA